VRRRKIAAQYLKSGGEGTGRGAQSRGGGRLNLDSGRLMAGRGKPR